MTTESVLSVPRLGEGIVEVRIVRFLKRPGDTVAKDEVVYEMEHDKAAVEIESPVAGTLEAWLVEVGDTVPIGGSVGRIVPLRQDVPGGAGGAGVADTQVTAAAGPQAPGASAQGVPGRPAGTRRIPPRTRAHARRLGIDESLLPGIPAQGTSLMPADLQRYIAERSGDEAEPAENGCTDVAQSDRQRALNRALLAARDQVVPAVVSALVDEETLQAALRRHRGTRFSTAFQAFAHHAARCAAAPEGARLRSRRLDPGTLRVHEHVDLGIAVATDAADLTVAVVREADTLPAEEFDGRYAQAVEEALGGRSQADGRVTLLLSHLGDRGPDLAVPVVVPPAVATLFLGGVDDSGTRPVRRMVLAFDHTVLNGRDASAYLEALTASLGSAGTADDSPETPVQAVPAAAPRGDVLERLVDLASEVLGHRVDPTRPLGEQGLDSARALLLIRETRTAFGVPLPATAVWRHPTLEALAELLSERARDERTPTPQQAPEHTPAPEQAPSQDNGPGTGTGTAIGTGSATASGAGTGSATASGAGTGKGSEPASGAGTGKGADDTGTRTGIGTGTGSGIGAGTGSGTDDAVAVIGMACRVPGADDAEAFWRLLSAGECRIGPVGEGRLAGEVPDGFRAGLLDRIDLFDADFFDVTPRQAASMDPQQRALLELSWHALEHAGLAPDTLAGTPVGVYAATCSYDYREQLVAHGPAADGYATTGTLPAFLANRISHLYDFTGPSITVDTACSGALTALSLAEAAVRSGACEVALAGAANLLSNGFNARAYRRAGMLSPQGGSRVFDADADGFVRGEGAGWLVLKSLRRALADGDPVLAVVRGTAVNHGGRAAALTAPNPRAQSGLIRTALDRSGLSAADLGFLEAHGTGTPLGDPIELDAFREVLDAGPQGMPERAAGPEGRVWVGSAKANIGHLEGASGLAGVIKAVQVLRHGLIPGTPGFTRLNPHIELDGTPVRVAAQPVPWPAGTGGAPRRAAVSAFGFGGSNAHVVLEEAPQVHGTRTPGGGPFAVPLSAATPGSLTRLAASLAELAAGASAPALDEIAWTLQSGRRHLAHRALFVVRDLDELAEAARAFATRGEHDEPADPWLRDWLGGADTSLADWAGRWSGGPHPRRVPLVPYPFERDSHWLPGAEGYVVRAGDPLAEHRVGGTTTLPGAALIDALAEGGPVALRNLRFLRPVPVPAQGSVRLLRGSEETGGAVRITVEHDGATVARAERADAPAAPLPAGEPHGPARDIDLRGVLAGRGIVTGPVYDVVRDLRRQGEQARAHLVAPAASDARTRRVAWLDAVLQTSLSLTDAPGLQVAAAAEQVDWSGTVPERADLRIVRTAQSATHTVVDLEAQAEGRTVLRVAGLRLHATASARAEDRSGRGAGVFGPEGSEGPAGSAFEGPDSRTAGTVPAPGMDSARRAGIPGTRSGSVPVPARAGAEGASPAAGSASVIGGDGARTGSALLPATAGAEGASPAAVSVPVSVPGDVRVLVPEWQVEAAPADSSPVHDIVVVHDADSAWLAGSTGVRGVSADDPGLVGALRGAEHVALLVDGSRWSEDAAGVRALGDRLETLLTIARAQDGARLTLVTVGLTDPDGGAPRPGAALQGALLGALRTLPREVEGLTAAAVDLDADAGPAELAAALAEPCAPAVPLVALRGGRRLRQIYADRPAPAPAAGGDGFVTGGTYVLFGGAGGIGAEVARHLARRYRARLLIVGRSPADERTSALIDRLSELGARARYFSADIAEPTAVERAVAACRAAFGEPDGVVHSVGSLSPARLDTLRREDLDRVLATKVTAVLALRRALRERPEGRPAALVLFSSAAGLFGSVGGLNYSAANAFLGHYATAADGDTGLAVRAFDWGLWRDTGLARRYTTHVAREYPGITAFDPERGVAALEAGMSGNRPQSLVLSGDPEPLRPLTAPATAGESADPARRLDTYARGALAHRMTQLGLAPALAARPATDTEAAATLLGIVPEHRRLLAAILELLAEHAGAGASVPSRAELDRTRDRLLADHPDLAGHLTLLDRTLESYGPVLRGELPATAVLFPGGDLSGVTAVYSGNQLFDPVNAAAAEALADGAAALRAPRILEIGAGVGGTTTAALAALDARGVRDADYTYTDVSPAFLQHGRRRFGDRVTPRLLDIEKNPEPQGFPAAAVDLVVASNVIHATRDLSRTLDHIGRLLAPGGRLLLAEMVAPAAVYTLTFGLTDGWWRYVDTDRRMPHGPLLDVPRWRALLEEHGWRLTGVDRLRDVPGCVALLTCLPPGAEAPGEAAAAADPAVQDIAEGLRAVVRDLLGDPAADVPGYLPWQELGVDSLLNMELVEAVSRRYGPVTATALFEHRTVDDLAAMLAARGTAAPGRAAERSAALQPVRTPPSGDVLDGLLDLVAELTARDRTLLDPDRDFPALGVDSLLNEEFCERLRARYPERTVTSTLLFEHPTPRDLALHLAPAPSAPLPMRMEAEQTVREVARPHRAAPVTPVAASPERATDGDAIAVVGLAGRYPGAADVDAFWELLDAGRTPVREVPAERWDWRTARTLGGGYARWGCFVDGIDAFDPAMFRLTPREAALMDPQERLFLEIAKEAFENAGYARRSLAGSHGGPSVAVFAGVTANSHLLVQRDARAAGADNPEYAVTAAASVANRVSHVFDLSGPSLTVDTMCSSSLTALHLACRALQNGEADLALAGGVNLYLHPDRFTGLCALGMPSRGEHTRAFGAGGDGFVPGEGAGAVVLKRLDRAEADGDTIHAVIRGTGLNHGGGTGGYTVPNPRAQAALIDATLRRSGVDPSSVGYLEAHGTGTELGDPVELRALALAFEDAGTHGPLRVGSVKSNIGHAEAAAGIAGLTKAILQLRHARLVPTLHAERPNPKLGLDGTALRIQTAAEPWSGTVSGTPRRAAVSSFGAGGSNAHVVLEEYREDHKAAERAAGPVLIPLSAPDAGRLADTARALAAAVDGHRLTDIAHTLHTGRDHGPCRAAVTAHDTDELRAALRALADGADHPALLTDPRADGAEDAARAWVADAACAPTAGGRRVPLPGTPFARVRCALPESGTSPMPLTDTLTVPAARTVTARLGGASRWVADHVVDGEALLPGAFHPELVHEALLGAGGNPYRTVLRDLVWPRPAAGLPMTVSTVLEEPDGRGSRRFRTCVEDDVVAQGWVDPAPAPGADGPVRPVLVYRTADLDAHIGAGDGEDFYGLFAAHGFSYGPMYRTVRRAVVRGEEVTAQLRLAEGEDPDGRHVMHPALLDGACQTAAYLLLREGSGAGRTLRPLAVERMTVHQPTTGGAYVHARRVRHDTAAGIHVFDLNIVDPDSGDVLADVTGFRVLVDEGTRPQAAPRPAATSTTHTASDPVPVRGYTTDWSPAPAGAAAPDLPQAPLWVVGTGASGWDAQAAATLGAEQAADEETLAETARRTGPPAVVLVDLAHGGAAARLGTAPLSPDEVTGEWQRFVSGELAPAFRLLRAFVRSRALDGARVLLVTRAGRDGTLPPLVHGLHSLARTVAGETGRFTVRLVTLDGAAAPTDVTELLAEAARPAAGADWVRLGGSGRRVSVLRPLAGAASTAPDTACPPLRPDGTYLVTGGLGGLGRHVAADILARTPGARLVLVGRSEPDAAALKELGEQGRAGAVTYRRCDVADADDMAALGTWLARERVQLRGVVHTAGVLRDGFLRGKTAETVEEVCRAKVLGALRLDAALTGHPLDFFVLASSLAALVGNQGQSDYAFANGFLDGFAACRAATGRPGRTLSVGWPVLADAGMAPQPDALAYLADTYGLRPVATRAALSRVWPLLAPDATTPYAALAAGDLTAWEAAVGVVTGQPAPVVGPARTKPRAPVTSARPETAPVPQAAPGGPEQSALRWITGRVARTVGRGPGDIDLDPEIPLADHGLDSIALMRLARILEDDLGRVPLPLLLDSTGLRDLTERLLASHGAQLTALAAEGATTAPAAPAAPVADATFPAPLPDRLVGMWAADQAAAPHTPYNISLSWRLPEGADREAVRAAVADLVRRHPLLGCCVRTHNGSPAFVPAPDAPALVTRIVDGEALERAVADEADRRLRTSAEPLLRAVLWEVAGERPVLQLTTHHIAVDGRSADLLRRDITALYEAHVRGVSAGLPEAGSPAAALRRERDAAEPAVWAEAERHWSTRLADATPAGVLFPGGGEQAGAAGAHREYTLPGSLTAALGELARAADVPRFTAWLGAFALSLTRATGRRSFLVAVPTYGRSSAQDEATVGCFVNTVPVRVDVDPALDPAAWLRVLGRSVREALAHAALPYPRFAALCRAAHGDDALPTVTLAYQNWERDDVPAPAGWEPVHRRGQQGHFDLGLEITDTPDGTEILANHRTAVLDGAGVDRFVEDLRRTAVDLAAAARTTTGTSVADLLDPAAGTLVTRFAATVRRCPDATAVEDHAERLSYAELDALSDTVARRVDAAARPGEPVAVLMHRSARLPAVLLGILKSGRPYVPLDDSYPSERLSLVVEGAGCAVAVADRDLTWLLPGRLTTLDPADLRDDGGTGAPAGSPPAPTALAYLMFTSGSTGRPKGVGVTHANVVHTLEAIAAKTGIDERDPARLLAVTTVCFDISVLELFLPLLTGGTVVVAERTDVVDARRLARLIESRGITAMQATPAGWQLLVDGGWSGADGLVALCGGEALPGSLATALTGRTGSLWNVYGPTEATIWSTIARVTDDGPVHLGEPIGATELVLTEVDGHRPAAPGEPGELWIGGAGVAQGYWRQPGLTAERFTGHPVRATGGGRWFRTGDLVRRDEAGRLLFLGRADSQVKIRGHRIELGEIEAVLSAHPALARVVLAVRGEGPSARLLVIAVPRAGSPLPDLAALRDFASASLPPWMLPDRLVAAEELPLTPNGKVDRKEAVRLAAQETPAAPSPGTPPKAVPGETASVSVNTDALRAEVLGLWRELLETDDVPADRRFFDLGGNSLLLGQLFARLDAAYPDTGIELADLFARPTVDDQVGLLAGRLGATTPSAPAATAAAPDRPSRRELRRAFRLGDER
ncbi:amino acid adenylation domain-containing protein [Streptomyces sp. NPDC059524]|uniref:amino acid adenylation domain-containing protein n=1 Tax=Streptomyces sp. NPDC059524 TaxID=3346856 RepID=UPI0036A31C85